MDRARKYAQTLLFIGIVMCAFGSCGAQSAWSMVDARSQQSATSDSPYAETSALITELLTAAPLFRALSIANLLLSLMLLWAGIVLIAQTFPARLGQPPGAKPLSALWWSNQATTSNALWCLCDGLHNGWVMFTHRESLIASVSRSPQVIEAQSEHAAPTVFVTILVTFGLRGLIGTTFFLWLGHRVRTLNRLMRADRESEPQP